MTLALRRAARSPQRETLLVVPHRTSRARQRRLPTLQQLAMARVSRETLWRVQTLEAPRLAMLLPLVVTWET